MAAALGLVRPLADLSAGHEGEFGGKAASLGELLGADLPVPPGFAISVAAFEEHLRASGLRSQIDSLIRALDLSNLSAVRDASREIAEAMRGEPLLPAICTEIESHLEVLADEPGQEPFVAVRSSARGEDGPDATFAGQQDTSLWLRGAEAIVDAVRECWTSVYSPEALTYRSAMAGLDEPAMGVVIQAMVDAATAGVMFTCGPATLDPSVIAINAGWGLGLGVVGGELTPDQYTVSKVTGEVLSADIAHKAIEYRPDPRGNGALQIPTPAARADVACLEPEQIQQLADEGRRIEGHFGTAQDIEWAFQDRGERPAELFVLQSRPVTGRTAHDAPGANRPRSAMARVMETFGADG